jgi:hypothetical protein
MENHPVIVASRSTLPPSSVARPYAAEIALLSAPSVVAAGAPVRLRVRVRNTGGVAWDTRESPRGGHVRLGVQLLDPDQLLVDREFHREDIPVALAPDRHAELEVICSAPPIPGIHYLKLDLVAEGVTWFEPAGSTAVTHRIEVP